MEQTGREKLCWGRGKMRNGVDRAKASDEKGKKKGGKTTIREYVVKRPTKAERMQ